MMEDLLRDVREEGHQEWTIRLRSENCLKKVRVLEESQAQTVQEDYRTRTSRGGPVWWDT